MSDANDIMIQYGWAANDMQRVARRVSLLVASLGTPDDLDETSFYSDIATLTNPIQMTTMGQRIAAALTDADRSSLRKLKTVRDELVYRFFITYKVERDQENMDSASALEKLKSLQQSLNDGQAVLQRLYHALA